MPVRSLLAAFFKSHFAIDKFRESGYMGRVRGPREASLESDQFHTHQVIWFIDAGFVGIYD